MTNQSPTVPSGTESNSSPNIRPDIYPDDCPDIWPDVWIDKTCLRMQGSQKDFKIEWNATRYFIGAKMFAMRGHDNKGTPILTLKCDPAHGAALREQYPDIQPGYYMNKLHWNSVDLNGDVPRPVVQEMIEESYCLILRGLPKKLQKEIVKVLTKE